MVIASGGVVFRSIPSYNGFDHNPKSSPSSIPRVSHVGFRERNRFPSRVLSFSARAGDGWCCGRYEDEGHLEYYSGGGSVRAGESEKKGRGKRMSMKKRMKLVDRLFRGLSDFSDIDGDGVVSDPKGKMISEAAELLLSQLKQLRKEASKMEKKEEKKRNLKAAQLEMEPGSESSSSSSSESSDSECEEVVGRAKFKRGDIHRPVETALHLGSQDTVLETSMNNNLESDAQNVLNQGETCCKCVPASTDNMTPESTAAVEPKVDGNCSKIVGLSSPTACSPIIITDSSLYDAVKIFDFVGASSSLVKKVEVCMGGKCKKLGAPALMEEFQRVLGMEAAVIGCKCMGKCKSAPNVRVNVTNSNEIAEASSNPLFIGVGLDDVGLIVAQYLGDEVKDCGAGIAAACVI